MSVHEDMDPSARQAPGPEAERWLLRLRASDCGAAERARFEQWRANAANARAFAAAEHYWQRAHALRQDPDLLALADGLLARRRQRRALWGDWIDRLPMLAGAAVVLAVVAGAAIHGYRSGWLAPAPQLYATPVGERRNVTLEDGSTLVLNTDTALEVRYRGDARRITLVRGEAQFDVQHDPRRPFSVVVGHTAVTALGTRFQVRTDKRALVVTLLEGRVRVTEPASATAGVTARERGDAGAGRSAELRPGERLSAPQDGAPWQRQRIDTATAAGWTEGRLVFRALPLPQAVEELNRYALHKIELADGALDEIRVNGVFDAGDTESVLAALQFAYPIHADRPSPTRIVLRHREPPTSK